VIAAAIPDAMLLPTRPVYMDDNARPHRSRAVTAYLQSEAVTSVPWQQLSQQDIRRLTGGMRHRVVAIIQAHGGYTWY
jgi:hypothetical protein